MLEQSGISISIKVSICQNSLPTRKRKSVEKTTTPTAPQAKIAWSLLISLSGSLAGMAAIIGLISTSASPLASENITVPMSRPIYTLSGNRKGARAYTENPTTASTGITRTVREILNL